MLAMTVEQRRAFLEGTTEPRQTGVVQVRGQSTVERAFARICSGWRNAAGRVYVTLAVRHHPILTGP